MKCTITDRRTKEGREARTEALLEVGEEGEGLVAQPVPEAGLLLSLFYIRGVVVVGCPFVFF